MITLGIYSLGADPSAAIIIDGHTKAYVEEERLIRLKHANGVFPIRAIEQVLKQANLSFCQIDNIAIPWDTSKYDDQTIFNHYESINKIYRITHVNDLSYEKAKLNEYKSKEQKSIILFHLRKHFGNIEYPNIHFVSHHLSHACTAYFTSGLLSSLVMVIDGSGEEITISIWEGKGNTINLIEETKTPVSIGWFYSAVTEYLGFNAYGDEWQVMGLSSYGSKSSDYYLAKEKFQNIIWCNNKGKVNANPHLLSLGEKTFSSFCSDSFISLMGHPLRSSKEVLTQWHKDVALAAQDHLESVVRNLASYWMLKLNNRNICLAGGVAMNVKMNGHLFESDFSDTVYVYPIASDCGTSVGAALAHQLNANSTLPNLSIEDVYLGNSYSDEEVEVILINCKLSYSKPDDLTAFVAKKITEGNVVGWFQGKMEGGQRALGSRSILADARNVKSADLVNSIVKFREKWRPFGPSMLAESALRYFDLSKKVEKNICNGSFKFMTLALTANKLAKREIPAVIHVDGTSRIQILSKAVNNRYYELLMALREITGIGVVLNTSFNIKGEPIVCSPFDAIRTFYGTGLDLLVVGNCVLMK